MSVIKAALAKVTIGWEAGGLRRSMHHFAAALFRESEVIRYVAVYVNGDLQLAQRPNLEGASAAESDRYEELLVNPTLLFLARQRGEIDCGGLEYVLIRYGNFFTLACPVSGGHVSIGIEPNADPVSLVEIVRETARASGLLA